MIFNKKNTISFSIFFTFLSENYIELQLLASDEPKDFIKKQNNIIQLYGKDQIILDIFSATVQIPVYSST